MEQQTIKKHKSGFAITSLVLGIISFFPLIGVVIGILAVIFGIVALVQIKKNELGGKGMGIVGIILGVCGILFTVILYGSIFYFGFVAKEGPFKEVRIEASQQVLKQDAGTLELYKKQKGYYPESLDMAREEGYTIYGVDHYMNPLFYKVSEDRKSYELRSLGVDGEYGTEDDIFLNL